MLRFVGLRSQGIVLALLLMVAMISVMGFSTTAGAAALKRSHTLAGASGTGVNAPPPGTTPLYPGKWDAQNYRIPHHVASCPQPPANVADRLALQSSPLMLDYYGLPHLSIFKGDLTKWRENIIHSVIHECDTDQPVQDGKLKQNTTFFSGGHIWGGYGSQCRSCNDYASASAEFLVPQISQSYNGVQDSIWVGIGGANSDALAQDGVTQNSQYWTNTYHAFYESVGCGVNNGVYEISGYEPWSGDHMYAYTSYTGYDIVDDYSQNQYFSTTWGCGARDSAEYIIERPGGTGGYPLSNYSEMTWDYAEFTTLDGQMHNVDYRGLYYWYLTGSGTAWLENVDSFGYDNYGNTFRYYWLAGQ